MKHQKRGKKDQRSPASLGGISNLQTDPEAGPNYQSGKLNGEQERELCGTMGTSFYKIILHHGLFQDTTGYKLIN